MLRWVAIVIVGGWVSSAQAKGWYCWEFKAQKGDIAKTFAGCEREEPRAISRATLRKYNLTKIGVTTTEVVYSRARAAYAFKENVPLGNGKTVVVEWGFVTALQCSEWEQHEREQADDGAIVTQGCIVSE